MAVSLLKLRSKQSFPRRILSENSPYILSDCLQVSQKTIVSHSPTVTRKATTHIPPPEVKAVSRGHAPRPADPHSSWRVVRLTPWLKATPRKGGSKDSPRRSARRDDHVYEQMACPVINVQIRKKSAGEDEENQRIITPCRSPRQVSRDSAFSVRKENEWIPSSGICHENNNDKQSHDVGNGEQKCSNFKRKQIVVRGSMMNSKRLPAPESKNSSNSKTSEVDGTGAKEFMKKSSILAKRYTPEAVTSVLQTMASSMSKRSGSSEKSNLWQIPKDAVKNSDVRAVKRSKTSTGHYAEKNKTLVPSRETKSARPQRHPPGQTAARQPVSDSQCTTVCRRLEEFLYHENLPKFQELLTSFPSDDRKRLVDFKETDTTANVFFRASSLVRVPFVRYMLDHCNPDLELTGPFWVDDDRTQYMVTPFWHAAISGSLELVHILKENGADINTASDTGSSPLLAACFMSRVEVATYLVSNKASINASNAKGLTCLMNSVQSPDLVRLLVLNGAEVNRADNSGNTPMHFATEEGHLKTVKILLEHGGNPSLVNNDGYSAIQFAAKYRRREILEYFLQMAPLKVEAVVAAYEMIGAMVIMMEEDVDGGFLYLHKATTLRSMNRADSIAKHAGSSLLAGFGNDKEFSNLQELMELANNPTKLCIQALMIYERQMGSSHDDFRSMLLYCGATFADNHNFKGAANLWRLSYQLYFEKHVQGPERLCDPFNHNVLKSLTFVVKLLFQWKKVYSTKYLLADNEECFDKNDDLKIPEINVRCILRMLCLHTASADMWLKNQPPVLKNRYKESFNLLLRSTACVLLVYAESFSRSERSDEVWQYVKYVVSSSLRGERDATILHMCLSMDTLRFLDQDVLNPRVNWPSVSVVSIVLILGANPTDCDEDGNTPLHFAAMLHKQGVLSEEDSILQYLLSKGAHADQVNKFGKTAFDLLDCKAITAYNDLFQRSVSLKCLAARVIVDWGIQYTGEVPVSLYSFIELHRNSRDRPKLSVK